MIRPAGKIIQDAYNIGKVKLMSSLYKTGKAAELAGVSKQTLQYYLLVGLVEPSDRSSGGRQLFDDKAVERIKLIKRLNESGYPLREIRDIFLK